MAIKVQPESSRPSQRTVVIIIGIIIAVVILLVGVGAWQLGYLPFTEYAASPSVSPVPSQTPLTDLSEFFDSDSFRELRVLPDIPVKPGETGKDNPFTRIAP